MEDDDADEDEDEDEAIPDEEMPSIPPPTNPIAATVESSVFGQISRPFYNLFGLGVSVTDAIYLVLVCMIALTVVMMMRVVGLILVIALLTMPAAISALFTTDIRKMMVGAAGLGVLFTTVGLWISYAMDVTSGAAIILTTAAAYLLALAVHHGSRGLAGRARRGTAEESAA